MTTENTLSDYYYRIFRTIRRYIFFLWGASLILSSVFSVWSEIWFCKHSPEWRNVWKTWGFFFVYLSFFVQTRDLFFVFPIIYVITLEWSDRQLDNCKQIYAIYMNFHLFFSVFSWSYLWFYWMFLKQNERVLLRWQTLFFRCCYF